MGNDNNKQWLKTADEVAAEDARSEQAVSPDNVLSAEALAMQTGITGDQAVDLIERLGSDHEALVQAALALRAQSQ